MTGALARRYAKALLSIGISQNSFDTLGKEIDQFKDLMICEISSALISMNDSSTCYSLRSC